MIVIVDGGSTKCDWVLLNDAGEFHSKTQTIGFNPNIIDVEKVPTELENNNELKDHKYTIKHVFFYGSGCGVEENRNKVEAALKKANINPAHVDSEEHMESNMAKGWITAEDIAKAKEIIATVSAEKAAHLPEQMIQNIAKGRVGKFLKENCLVCQEFQFGDGDKQSVADYLKKESKDLKIVAYKRFTLAAE